MRLLLPVSILVLGACAAVPRHDIPVHADYINAGIGPGDRIELTTADGRQMELVVAEVDVGTIVAEDGTIIEFTDIAALTRRSWTPPTHPCGAGLPVDCSVPEVVVAVDQRFKTRFHQSCVQHDYCYRHGYATYGRTREACDDTFYASMKAQCGEGKLFGVIHLGNPLEHAECLAIAETMYQAVRRYGEPGFHTSTSTVCPYELKK